MNRRIYIPSLILLLVILSAGCRQAKYVPEGQYLLKSNEIQFPKIKKNGKKKYVSDHPLIDEGSMEALVRPAPNRKLALFFYNRIDTTKHKNQVDKKKKKFRQINKKRQAREDRINRKRIKKAESKGDSLYRHKVIEDRTVRLGWREWVRNNMGEPPVALDTARVAKSKKQIEIYLVKKGFYSGEVRDTIVYNEKKRKAEVKFIVIPGEPYRIRQLKFDSIPENEIFIKKYNEMVEEDEALIIPGNLLDQDVLDAERDRFSQYCRNEAAMLGFNKNYVGFVVDTTVGNKQADVTIYIKPKIIKNPADEEEKIIVEHKVYRIRDVTFYLHNTDPSTFKDYDAYVRRCDSLGIELLDETNNYHLLDTIRIYGKGTFIFNQIPFVNPDLLDRQNFLEIDRGVIDSLKYYAEYYVERSYRTMASLGVFSNIKPKVEVDPNEPLGRWVVVSYDLYPNQKQSFLFEPRVSNTNGILGINGTVAYTNKNLARGAQLLTVSFTGGMESQPLIVGRDGDDNRNGFELNTFEWGPRISLEIPKLAPMPKKWSEGLSKRAYPKTVIDLTINYQRRTEFKRSLIEVGYLWNFEVGKTQSVDLGWCRIDYVNLDKEDFFQEQLDLLNDPFYLNTYQDNFATITSLGWHYNNTRSNTRTKKHFHDLTLIGAFSGKGITPLIYDGLLGLGANFVSENANGQERIFGVPYAEFTKLDAQYISSIYINKKNRFVYRGIAGAGWANGNSPSLPYQQAYFAGGSNDIRAFQARTMAPGSFKTYADTNSTLTQLGDIKLEVNAEWRFEMTSLLEGAFFVDAGNIWNMPRDTIAPNDPSILKPSSWKEIAVGVGYGIRADFDFLIIRFDFSFALHNPHMPVGERWWLSDKPVYRTFFEADPDTGELLNYESPHPLRINFGIGYPF